MHLESSASGFRAIGDATFDVNAGDLCMKGYSARELLTHPERLLTPLVRCDGELHAASWDQALDAAASGFAEIAARRGKTVEEITG